MIIELSIVFLVSCAGTAVGIFVFGRSLRTMLFSLEDSVAELQTRHLSIQRKLSVGKRWENDDQLDLAVERAAAAAIVPEKAKVAKWASKSASSSDGSQAAL